ncbi:hypothetical protein DM860_011898 [Cuscuta australis]|uniref:glutathione transferase n=1 Tax=Cuscuta australis TaxID=267555 RepID=A0A328D8R9_9ASTE|nr:hypothetical protein DM860_011898 [Cuscuta australis]
MAAEAAALKVHGIILSPPVQRVIACLKEKELDYEFNQINLQTGEHKQQPFISLNPFGKVPAFEDKDLKLFESRAITQYVAQTYADSGTRLVPTNPKEVAIMSVWVEVEAHHFDPAAFKLNYELVIKPILGKVTDEAVVAEHEAALGKVLDVYEGRLAASKYLAGDSFTLADLHHAPLVNYLMGTRSKDLFESRAHVRAWAADILARPAWAKVQELINQFLQQNFPKAT